MCVCPHPGEATDKKFILHPNLHTEGRIIFKLSARRIKTVASVKLLSDLQSEKSSLSCTAAAARWCTAVQESQCAALSKER